MYRHGICLFKGASALLETVNETIIYRHGICLFKGASELLETVNETIIYVDLISMLMNCRSL